MNKHKLLSHTAAKVQILFAEDGFHDTEKNRQSAEANYLKIENLLGINNSNMDFRSALWEATRDYLSDANRWNRAPYKSDVTNSVEQIRKYLENLLKVIGNVHQNNPAAIDAIRIASKGTRGQAEKLSSMFDQFESLSVSQLAVLTDVLKKLPKSEGGRPVDPSVRAYIGQLEEVYLKFVVPRRSAGSRSRTVKRKRVSSRKSASLSQFVCACLDVLGPEHRKDVEAVAQMIKRIRSEGKKSAK